MGNRKKPKWEPELPTTLFAFRDSNNFLKAEEDLKMTEDGEVGVYILERVVKKRTIAQMRSPDGRSGDWVNIKDVYV